MKKLIVFALVLAVLTLCFGQSNPYRIKEGGDAYTAKMVGVSGTRTSGTTVTEAYSSYYDLHQGLIVKSGFYDHWYDPNGGTTWNLDAYWDAGKSGKFLEGADMEYPWTVLMDELTFDSAMTAAASFTFEDSVIVDKIIYGPANRTGYTSYLKFTEGSPVLYFHWESPYVFTQMDSLKLKLYGTDFQMRYYAGGANDTIVDIDVSTKQMTFNGKIRSVESRLGYVSYLDLRDTHVGLDFNWQYKYARFDSTRADLLGMPFTVGSYQGGIDTTLLVTYSTGVVLKNGRPNSPQQGSMYFSYSGTSAADTGWVYNGSAWRYTLYVAP